MKTLMKIAVILLLTIKNLILFCLAVGIASLIGLGVISLVAYALSIFPGILVLGLPMIGIVWTCAAYAADEWRDKYA